MKYRFLIQAHGNIFLFNKHNVTYLSEKIRDFVRDYIVKLDKKSDPILKSTLIFKISNRNKVLDSMNKAAELKITISPPREPHNYSSHTAAYFPYQ